MPIFSKILLGVIAFLLFSPVLTSGASLSIAMILWRGETDAERGFKQGLNELGYTASYTSLNASQDIKQLGRILKDLSSRKDSFDYVYTFGTTVSRRTRHILQGSPPQVFNIVTDPVRAGIINEMKLPGDNISGASDAVPISIPLDYLGRIVQLKTLGLFFNPREKNSMLIREEVKDLARLRNFNLIEYRTPPVDEILQDNLRQVRDNPNNVDCILLPPDSYLTSKSQRIAASLLDAGIMTMGTVRETIENGIFFGVVVDYFELGRKVSSIVDLHQKGRPLGEIPIATATEHTLIINSETWSRFGTLFPPAILEKATFVP